MGSKSKKAPKAPDYTSIAKTQAETEKSTATDLTKANRPTQIDQFGNRIDWTQDAGGNWTQQVTMSPDMLASQNASRAAYDAQMAKLNGMGDFNAPGTGQAQGLLDQMTNRPDFTSNAGQIGNFTNNAGQIGDFTNNAGTIGDFTNTAGTIGDFDRTQGDKVAADVYESVMGRARPEQQRETSALDVQLRQQGLQPGTEAYNRAMQNLTTAHGDVSTQAGLDSTLAGYNAARDIYNTNLGGQSQRYGQLQGDYSANLAGQNQRFGQGVDEYNTNLAGQNQRYNQSSNDYTSNLAGQNQRFGQELEGYNANANKDAQALQSAQQLQAQQYSQALQNYALPLERAQATTNLLGSAPGGQWQGFSGATGYNPADLTGAAQSQYEAQMGGYNAGQNKKGGMMNTAGTLGGAAIGAFSDAYLKENIKSLVGKDALDTLLKLGGYEYDWKDGSGHDMGTIAQEVDRVLPDLIARAENGYLMVNYTGLFALAVEAIKYLAGEQRHGHV